MYCLAEFSTPLAAQVAASTLHLASIDAQVDAAAAHARLFVDDGDLVRATHAMPTAILVDSAGRSRRARSRVLFVLSFAALWFSAATGYMACFFGLA